LHEDIEQGDGEGQAHGEVAPGAVGCFFGGADLCEHREGGLDEHAIVPGPPRADLHVGWIALLASEHRIGEHNHPLSEAGDERVDGVVVGVGVIHAPGAHQAPLVEHDAKLAADDPAVVGHALAPDACEPTPALFAVGMGQLHAIAVGHPEDGRLRQEVVGPALVRREEAEQARALGQPEEQRAVVPHRHDKTNR